MQFIDGGIDHDPFHPSHQDLFIVFVPAGFIFRKVPEYLYKSIVYYICGLVIPVNVPEDQLKCVAIILFINDLLIFMLSPDTAFYDGRNVFQSPVKILNYSKHFLTAFFNPSFDPFSLLYTNIPVIGCSEVKIK